MFYQDMVFIPPSVIASNSGSRRSVSSGRTALPTDFILYRYLAGSLRSPVAHGV